MSYWGVGEVGLQGKKTSWIVVEESIDQGILWLWRRTVSKKDFGGGPEGNIVTKEGDNDKRFRGLGKSGGVDYHYNLYLLCLTKGANQEKDEKKKENHQGRGPGREE